MSWLKEIEAQGTWTGEIAKGWRTLVKKEQG